MKKYSEGQKRISMRFSKISGLEALKIYSNRFFGGREGGRFADPFNFGFRFGGGGRRRGQDLVYDAELSLEDVLKGKREEIELPKLEKCRNCAGTGVRLEVSQENVTFAMVRDR